MLQNWHASVSRAAGPCMACKPTARDNSPWAKGTGIDVPRPQHFHSITISHNTTALHAQCAAATRLQHHSKQGQPTPCRAPKLVNTLQNSSSCWHLSCQPAAYISKGSQQQLRPPEIQFSPAAPKACSNSTPFCETATDTGNHTCEPQLARAQHGTCPVPGCTSPASTLNRHTRCKHGPRWGPCVGAARLHLAEACKTPHESMTQPPRQSPAAGSDAYSLQATAAI